MSAIEDARATLRGYDMSFEVHEVLRRLIADYEAPRVTPVTDAQVNEAAVAFAFAEHGDSAEQQDADYYAPKIRAALEAAREAS
jgi:hypothetical protein